MTLPSGKSLKTDLLERILHDFAGSIGNICNGLELCEMRRVFTTEKHDAPQDIAVNLLKSAVWTSKKLLVLFRYLFSDQSDSEHGVQGGFRHFYMLFCDMLDGTNGISVSHEIDMEKKWDLSANGEKLVLLLIFLCRKMFEDNVNINLHLSELNQTKDEIKSAPKLRITITEHVIPLHITMSEVDHVGITAMLKSIVNKEVSHSYGQYAVFLMEKTNVKLEYIS